MSAHTKSLQRPGSWRLYLAHRLSGLALAFFLPLHFLVLGQALTGAAPLQTLLDVTRTPAVRVLEWAVVVALAAHLAAGIRVLCIEFLAWHALQKTLSTLAIAFTTLFGLAYLLVLIR
ncbi:succinate dehydrogenase [Pandoraea sp.]|uniref:succinate dehydrogenase n=1 Tax=Pandoraea sp. TaxID=1883445 RepID=UPI0011F8962D|nr:succinate dehydrogenase [Pandoraea sp.]TAL57021.1 MAG: succinate dehydrogenase [Pandoraea sp.]TAM18064.1 MAG: succinate dehydrogenase [Pandoraea sp.]